MAYISDIAVQISRINRFFLSFYQGSVQPNEDAIEMWLS